jgi:hypothetical protein
MMKRIFAMSLVLVVLFVLGGRGTYAASATSGVGSGWALGTNSVLNTARAIRPHMAFGIGDDFENWLFGDNHGKNNHDDGGKDGYDHGKKGRKVGVPEPATLALILVGLAGVGAIRRRRKVS